MKELHTQVTKSNPGVYVDTANTLSFSVKYSNAVYKLSNPRSFASPQLPLPLPLLHQAILPKPHYQFQKPTKSFKEFPPIQLPLLLTTVLKRTLPQTIKHHHVHLRANFIHGLWPYQKRVHQILPGKATRIRVLR